jgi:hypothetical protein
MEMVVMLAPIPPTIHAHLAYKIIIIIVAREMAAALPKGIEPDPDFSHQQDKY